MTDVHTFIGGIGDLYWHLSLVRGMYTENPSPNRKVAIVYTYLERYEKSPDTIKYFFLKTGLFNEVHVVEGGRMAFGKYGPTIGGECRYFRPGVVHKVQGDFIEYKPTQKVLPVLCVNDYYVKRSVYGSFGVPQDSWYIVVQLRSSGKDMVASQKLIDLIPKDAWVIEMFDDSEQLKDRPKTIHIETCVPVISLNVIKYAATFIGIESSQFMAAMIHKVPCYYQPSGKLPDYYFKYIPNLRNSIQEVVE